MDTKPLENPLAFIFELAFKIAELTKKLVDFMTAEITLGGFLGFGEIELSVWQGLGGFGLTTLIVYSIVR